MRFFTMRVSQSNKHEKHGTHRLTETHTHSSHTHSLTPYNVFLVTVAESKGIACHVIASPINPTLSA